MIRTDDFEFDVGTVRTNVAPPIGFEFCGDFLVSFSKNFPNVPVLSLLTPINFVSYLDDEEERGEEISFRLIEFEFGSNNSSRSLSSSSGLVTPQGIIIFYYTLLLMSSLAIDFGCCHYDPFNSSNSS
ncbi:hypothetical protein BLOT_002187 [Blomia tropicalis]|nr:hypothetical protein BLOT_002187 [Blomia tropicalis]